MNASQILGFGGYPRNTNGMSEEAVNLLTHIAIRDTYREMGEYARALQLTNVLQLQARRFIAGTY